MNNMLNCLDTLSQKLYGKYFRELNEGEQLTASNLMQAHALAMINDTLNETLIILTPMGEK